MKKSIFKMKLWSVLACNLATANSEVFDPVTNVLPTDLPAEFNCEGAPGNGGGERIVGGTFAPTSWSFLVQLRSWKSETQAQNQPNNHDLCGGVIIHDRWVLTAAHCCENTNKKYHEVVFGVKEYDSSRFKMSVDLSRLHIHPDWTDKSDGSDMNTDYCLIELPNSVHDMREANCDGDICATRACLPKNSPPAGAACWVGGWGFEDYDLDNIPASLKSVGVNVFSEAYTKSKAKKALWQDIVFDDEFTAGLPDNNGDGLSDAGSDSCSGDSGGPLVCREGNNLIVYGLSSWGDSCGKQGLPSVYASVYPAMEWIESMIGMQVTSVPVGPGTPPTQPSTTTTTTSATDANECPEMKWKGRKSTKITYRGNTGSQRSYILTQSVLNNSDDHPNIRAGPYTGFFMFSRKHCGTAFFDGLSNGTIQLAIYDYEDNYEIVNKHIRIDGSKGSSITFQYYQKQLGEIDALWYKKTGNSLKKDHFMLAIMNIPDEFAPANEDKCFQLLHSVLPNGYSDDINWTECVSTQKNAGY